MAPKVCVCVPIAKQWSSVARMFDRTLALLADEPAVARGWTCLAHIVSRVAWKVSELRLGLECAKVQSVELFAGCQSITRGMRDRRFVAVGLDIKAGVTFSGLTSMR